MMRAHKNFSPANWNICKVLKLRLPRLILEFIGFATIFALTIPAIAQDNRCALILLHDKSGDPQNFSFFGSTIESECKTLAPDMPWSKKRNYDATLETAISEIKTQVLMLRKQGFKRVVLAGKGFGSNAAFAYMATEGDIDGIVVMTVWVLPKQGPGQGISRDVVDRAKELITVGKGDDIVEMIDQFQGQRITLSIRASTLFSYFNSDNLGHMPTAASKFKKSIPILWINGDKDPWLRLGSSFAFDKTPTNDSSQYLIVNAGRFNVPEKAADHIVYWLKNLE